MNKDLLIQPWQLIPNQIRAAGGREIDRFRGIAYPTDKPNGAEAWIGSVTRANGANTDSPNLGCAEVLLPNGERHYLFELLESAPEKILGKEHLSRYGAGLGILVKLLDAKEKFLLQAHPTQKTAKKLWSSNYGKTECWHVLSIRKDTEEVPSIWLGFKRGITKEIFEKEYRYGDIEAIENLCHRFPVNAGETWFIPSGMPHALGAGCFVIEVQEPTDLTAVPLSQEKLIEYRKKANSHGVFKPIDSFLYDQRVLETFQYIGLSESEVLTKCRIKRMLLRKETWGQEYLLIGVHSTPFFACTELNVKGDCSLIKRDRIAIGLVTAGEGTLTFPCGSLSVRRGSELFFPIHSESHLIGNLTMLFCYPGSILS